MSLSFSERQKLLNMLQRDFSSAKKWARIKINHNEARLHWAEFVALPVFMAATVGSICLIDWLFGRPGIWAFGGCMALGAVALVGTSVCAALIIHYFKSIEDGFKIRKMKKANQYKTWMRDYVALRTTKRKIAQMVPALSDEELDLLCNLPHLNEIFKPFFEKEVNKRQKEKSTQNITDQFLGSTVEVNAVDSKSTFILAPAKTLIV